MPSRQQVAQIWPGVAALGFSSLNKWVKALFIIYRKEIVQVVLVGDTRNANHNRYLITSDAC